MAHNGKSLVSVFKSLLLVLTKLSFWQGYWVMGYYSMVFILCIMPFVHTMFIGNNRASFDLWRKENLVKH